MRRLLLSSLIVMFVGWNVTTAILAGAASAQQIQTVILAWDMATTTQADAEALTYIVTIDGVTTILTPASGRVACATAAPVTGFRCLSATALDPNVAHTISIRAGGTLADGTQVGDSAESAVVTLAPLVAAPAPTGFSAVWGSSSAGG